MPKSESGGLGGASGSGSSSGVSSYFGKVFAVGRYQVTVEELVAEGMYRFLALQCVLNNIFFPFILRTMIFSGTHPSSPIWREYVTAKQLLQLCSFYGLIISLHSTVKYQFFDLNICLFPKKLYAE